MCLLDIFSQTFITSYITSKSNTNWGEKGKETSISTFATPVLFSFLTFQASCVAKRRTTSKTWKKKVSMHLPRIYLCVQHIANGNSINRRAVSTAVSIRFKCTQGLWLRRQWSVAGIRGVWKRQINMLALPFSCPLFPATPEREALSLSLAQLSRQLNIGIDFQSSGSVARLESPAEGLLADCSHCDRAITLQRYSFGGVSVRPINTGSIPRQLCAESGAASRSCRNLWFYRFRLGGSIERGKNIERCSVLIDQAVLYTIIILYN